MAQQGWHLQSPGVFGIYTFVRGEPHNVVYRLDYKTADKDMAEYLQLFTDAGWDYLGTMGGWRYFRKTCAEGETAEIYTDNASKIHKYQRVFFFLVIFLPIYISSIVTMQSSAYQEGLMGGIMKGISVIVSAFMVLYAYALLRIFLRIAQLKKQNGGV
jgi:hypothetical protein